MDHFLKNLNKWIAISAGFLIIVVTVLIVIDSVGRFLFNKPLIGGVEISILLSAFIVFLGLAYALIQGAHVQFTLFEVMFPPKFRRGCNVFINSVGMLFMALAFYATSRQFWESWVAGETMMAAVKIPYWLAKFALPIGFLLITVQFGFNIISILNKSNTRSNG
jgi:TRAP-type C4-dicarboxylate transport system permease small subunit